MTAPDQKAHATWSASATERNWNCAGAIPLGLELEYLDIESEAAAWGTACHTVSEMCLNEDKDADEFIDRVIKTKSHEFVFDEEMAETCQTYIDYVRQRLADYKAMHKEDAVLMIEQAFSLEKLKPPFDAGGTADAVIYFPRWSCLEVIDLKGGRGKLVEVEDNKQARTYAVGALLALPGYDVDKVMSTIVQPRMYHKAGRVRSETYHVIDLMEWTTDLVAAMRRTQEAAVKRDSMVEGAWADAYLVSGDHCAFCPAAGRPCPRLEQDSLDAIGLHFDDLDQPVIKNEPDGLDTARLARMLDAADMVTSFFNACRATAHRLADSGTEIPDYQLVEKRGRRRWLGEEDDIVAALSKDIGLTDDKLFARKLKSPAQIEKVLGKKALKEHGDALSKLIETPITGTNLVRADKSTRPAVEPSVNKLFDIED